VENSDTNYTIQEQILHTLSRATSVSSALPYIWSNSQQKT